ncbi:hypothetical protein [Phormidium sp. CCY1219]|uniref:hypothetical protein n=1 Tax=Phormidium sp. CCY1219 TaxID=2886104 RepID=UPI002D1EC463|nr:hypothetical protein [Phormidium sp. CCY1219]MEB3831198.1 hypothetical protein [Phormidium sp. CCY1219]
MSKAQNNGNVMVVDLAEGILVGTLMPKDNLPALRSGFAGYPVNPRWSVVKYRAWKTGRRLRESLDAGELMVRSTDSMLIRAEDAPQTKSVKFNKLKPWGSKQPPMVLV